MTNPLSKNTRGQNQPKLLFGHIFKVYGTFSHFSLKIVFFCHNDNNTDHLKGPLEIVIA